VKVTQLGKLTEPSRAFSQHSSGYTI